jgi:hypothetical protein
MHQLDLTLFEGEKRPLRLTVENIGLAEVRFLRLHCKEVQERYEMQTYEKIEMK